MASERLAAVTDRLRQIGQVFTKTREVDPRLVPVMVGIPLGVLAVAVGLGVLLDRLALAVGLGLPLALLVGVGVFGRRASRAMFSVIEGQPGAAAAVLQNLRGTWRVTPAVAATRKLAFVHRAVGRPGVVLVGEGSPARVRSLLKQEARKAQRVIGDTPVHEISVGDGDDQVPLPKLQTHVSKLRRSVRARDVEELHNRLKALGDRDMPLPKGPLPRGKRRM